MRLQTAIVRLRKAADWAELHRWWKDLLDDTTHEALSAGSQITRDLADAIESVAGWLAHLPPDSPGHTRACHAINAYLAALNHTVGALRELAAQHKGHAAGDAEIDVADDCEDAVEGLELRVQQLERVIRRTVPWQA